MKSFLTLIFVFITMSGTCQVKIINEFKQLINEPKNLGDQLLWNGYYNNATDFSQNTIRELPSQSVIFFKNGILSASGWSIRLIKSITAPKQLKKHNSYLQWGTYCITNDTISAINFVNYGEGSSFVVSNYQATHYSGIIKNKGEIVHWRAVPPYPKITTKFSQIDTTENSTLVYQLLAEKTMVDSTKAWVNMYRK